MEYDSKNVEGIKIVPTFALVNQLNSKKRMKAKETWKPVTISGFTGILMGAGAMYAAQKYVINDEAPVAEAGEEDQQLKEMVVDDNLSFREAFDTARAELGAGGVFHWHGKIFNTYTSDEWQAMTHEDKELFAQQVKPEVSPADIDTNQIAEAASVDYDVQVVDDIAQNVDVQMVDDVTVAAVNVDEQQSDAPVSEDDDVRIVGYGDIDLVNGNTVTVEELEINGQRVAVIDVDHDGVGDIAMSDLNHNNRPDAGEVIDLHTGDVLSFDNQTAVEDTDIPIDIMPA